MARKHKAKQEAAPVERPAGVVLQAQTMSGPVGVFPVPKPDDRPPIVGPARPVLERVVFGGNGRYCPRIDGKLRTIKFSNGKYVAQGAAEIEWCRKIGFPEATV